MTTFVEPLNEIIFYALNESPSAGVPTGLVSVIIASYNYEQYIIETLDSVALQSFPNLELVIVDDCSSDNSIQVILRWLADHQGRFARAILVKPTENQGLAQTRNSAVRLSRGRKLFVLDSDNILLPKAIERHAEVMERTNAQVVYSQFEWFDAEKKVGLADFWDVERFKTGNYVDAMAMLSRDAWDAIAGYSYFDVIGWEDYDLWLKFIGRGYRGVFIPEILCRYRVHRQSMSHAETGPKGLRLNIEMTARHPWLTL